MHTVTSWKIKKLFEDVVYYKVRSHEKNIINGQTDPMPIGQELLDEIFDEVISDEVIKKEIRFLTTEEIRAIIEKEIQLLLDRIRPELSITKR